MRSERYYQILADRERGMKYKELADKYGCTIQNISQMLAGSSNHPRPYYRDVADDKCIYPAILLWLRENKVTIPELYRKIYNEFGGQRSSSLSRCLRGKATLRKKDIDSILAITGMTYEEAFRTE